VATRAIVLVLPPSTASTYGIEVISLRASNGGR
jgi:hypothetical protein